MMYIFDPARILCLSMPLLLPPTLFTQLSHTSLACFKYV
jgi:hypothetical protein